VRESVNVQYMYSSERRAGLVFPGLRIRSLTLAHWPPLIHAPSLRARTREPSPWAPRGAAGPGRLAGHLKARAPRARAGGFTGMSRWRPHEQCYSESALEVLPCGAALSVYSEPGGD
jgi:hypothetical protein